MKLLKKITTISNFPRCLTAKDPCAAVLVSKMLVKTQCPHKNNSTNSYLLPLILSPSSYLVKV